MSLKLHEVSVTVQGAPLLRDVSFEVQPGKLVGLLGPNGAGKTTAVRALLGLQPLNAGRAYLDAQPAHSLSAKQRALIVSYLPQARKLAWPISVREAVALGRFAYGGPMGRLGPADSAAVEDALSRCALKGFEDRAVTSLSGGELARVHLARALAAQAPALIADEPTAALDPGHSYDVLAALQAQARAGQAVLVVLHDLALAARFCDEIILLNQGQRVIQAPPQEALTPPILAEVYGVNGSWHRDQLILSGRI
ncbi:MAG: ABC transporter ATP-binding protein [Hyphomonadaceae bacterium]|jgi:iron complex transport system ATP-binding protein|uniref:ABC transporter ATP-binding protein n=1 Tax=Aquidulcibacter sp. TaxID=2052990 RepID=UPI0022BDE631|nr:ABC transporter ATP-binding protein [Aquidulcibacter sp.]MCZ8209236.1 ABC transporter ATP-binding protein [Aquidulcibacter sp.]